jgi:hypothetical protein
MVSSSVTPIQRQLALHICADIRGECHGKWWTAAGMRCTLCRFYAGGDLTSMYWSLHKGNRGCSKINLRYDRLGIVCEPVGFDE